MVQRDNSEEGIKSEGEGLRDSTELLTYLTMYISPIFTYSKDALDMRKTHQNKNQKETFQHLCENRDHRVVAKW